MLKTKGHCQEYQFTIVYRVIRWCLSFTSSEKAELCACACALLRLKVLRGNVQYFMTWSGTYNLAAGEIIKDQCYTLNTITYDNTKVISLGDHGMALRSCKTKVFFPTTHTTPRDKRASDFSNKFQQQYLAIQ